MPATIVMAKDFMFAPVALTVPAGSTVTWTNKDGEPHTVVSESGLFRSAALDTNRSFFLHLRKAGHLLLCVFHSSAQGWNHHGAPAQETSNLLCCQSRLSSGADAQVQHAVGLERCGAGAGFA